MRKFRYMKKGKLVEEFEETNEEEAINDILRWEEMELIEVFEKWTTI